MSPETKCWKVNEIPMRDTKLARFLLKGHGALHLAVHEAVICPFEALETRRPRTFSGMTAKLRGCQTSLDWSTLVASLTTLCGPERSSWPVRGNCKSDRHCESYWQMCMASEAIVVNSANDGVSRPEPFQIALELVSRR